MGNQLEKKYPRTPHLFQEGIHKYLTDRAHAAGRQMDDDKMLSKEETEAVLSRQEMTYVWESKLDGTNVGILFQDRQLVLQNRGHVLKGGEHPQYDLLRNWAYTFVGDLHDMLSDKYIMYGEWLFAQHTVRYTSLPHYFHEFDIWDRGAGVFLDTQSRNAILEYYLRFRILVQVPVVHVGMLTYAEALKLVDHPPYYGEEKPEGLYLKVEKDGKVVERYKLVRQDFVQSIIEGEDHWSHKPLVKQGLAPDIDIMSTKPI